MIDKFEIWVMAYLNYDWGAIGRSRSCNALVGVQGSPDPIHTGQREVGGACVVTIDWERCVRVVVERVVHVLEAAATSLASLLEEFRGNNSYIVPAVMYSNGAIGVVLGVGALYVLAEGGSPCERHLAIANS